MTNISKKIWIWLPSLARLSCGQPKMCVCQGYVLWPRARSDGALARMYANIKVSRNSHVDRTSSVHVASRNPVRTFSYRPRTRLCITAVLPSSLHQNYYTPLASISSSPTIIFKSKTEDLCVELNSTTESGLLRLTCKFCPVPDISIPFETAAASA